MNETNINVNHRNPDRNVEKMLLEYDDTVIALPDIDFEPDLLISCVRRYYMEYLIQLLCKNYETNVKLVNKNINFPSAIWRCAKDIEMKAAKTCMLTHLYRRNIVPVIKQLKNDTKNGKLFKNLYECISRPAVNVKKTQTTLEKNNECNCICYCSNVNKRRRLSNNTINGYSEIHKIPVIVNMRNELEEPSQFTELMPHGNENVVRDTQNMATQTLNEDTITSPKSKNTELKETDEIMTQLEKIFYEDPNNDDDIFEQTLCSTLSTTANKNNQQINSDLTEMTQTLNKIIENQATQIKSLQERLTILEGSTIHSCVSKTTQQLSEKSKSKSNYYGKWMCEEYFQKLRLFEILTEIGDTDRKKLARIKQKFINLFGNDSDDEGVISPLQETPEFIRSCKERISPWVVKLLTPYYTKGRIQGKLLFKSLAKYLVMLIYQCSQYPEENEVKSFVQDFLENHKMIKCEADFKQFKIVNV